METVKDLQISNLKEKCKEQTSLFYSHKEHDTAFCYELFRRCFEEENQEALNAIYFIYRPQVRLWTKKHKYFYEIDAEEDEIVSDSMSQFIFALRRHSFHNFQNISTLLAYWRLCVNSLIILQWRKSERRKMLLSELGVEQESPDLDKKMQQAQIWERIEKILKNREDILLARLIYIYDMKPGKITAEYPELWKDANTVRVCRQRIKRHLEKDKILFDLLNELDL